MDKDDKEELVVVYRDEAAGVVQYVWLPQPDYTVTVAKTLDDIEIEWHDAFVKLEDNWPDSEVTKPTGVLNFYAEGFEFRGRKWETEDLRKNFYYDIVRTRGPNTGSFFVDGDVIVGYRIKDDGGWRSLEGRAS